MSPTIPPEIPDLIIDHLDDEPTTLKACCVVSKSWVPRTRKHHFARVEFDAWKLHLNLWKKTFPGPSNSPDYHTRTLSVCDVQIATVADAGVGSWIRVFHNIVDLRLSHPNRGSIAQFCGLSPTLRSLHLSYTHSKVFDLVCSFPLLEDLELVAIYPESETDGWNIPLTSPRLIGTLDLKTPRTIPSAARRSFGPPRWSAFLQDQRRIWCRGVLTPWNFSPSFVSP